MTDPFYTAKALDMNPWQAFEHQVHNVLKEWPLSGKRLVVGLSGGADSVALLHVLQRIQSGQSFQLSACHVHHGYGPDAAQNQYRDQAAEFCQNLCKQWKVEFHCAISDGLLESEEQLRNFRYQQLRNLKVDYIVMAHHQDDLLETRLLRLIRGTGMQGLQAMKNESHGVLRPFLSISRTEIVDYLQQNQVSWLQDPSNSNTDFLRNWLRQDWLPQLEARQPGSLKSLSRSLQHILREETPLPADLWLSGPALSLPVFLSLSVTQQKSVLASYLLSLGHKDFTRAQLEEVIKHLDKKQIEHTFRLARLDWYVDAQQICVKDAKI